MFGHKNPGFDAIAPVTPPALAAALAGSRLAEDAAKFLTVMAFVDGTLDKTKIATVLRYARRSASTSATSTMSPRPQPTACRRRSPT